MAERGTRMPDIAVSRASTESKESSKQDARNATVKQWQPLKRPTLPRVLTDHRFSQHWRAGPRGDTWKHMHGGSDPEWKIKWDNDCFPNGRVMIIDYISNDACNHSSPGTKRHVQIAAQEFQQLHELRKFYSDPRRAKDAALRVIHVQNATWATLFLLKKFNIDHPNEVVGMQGFNKWARYEKPRQRNGKPFPNGRTWREQLDPWRNISRTAFGLDYLKTYRTEAPARRHRRDMSGDKPIDAKMMHLNAYSDSSSPYGYDVSVQRLSVYVQRNLGPVSRVSPELIKKNPYGRQSLNGNAACTEKDDKVLLEYLDNTNTVIVFETSASMLLDDCLVQPRNDIEKRWRRLSFYLRKDDVLNDARLAAQCTNLILGDVFHGLAVAWDGFLSAASDHVAILEDKIYENPADESRAPELWINQAAWLKVEKINYIHSDLVREMQGNMRDLADADEDIDEPVLGVDWLSSTAAEYDRLTHMVTEDLVQPTNNLSDLMYKSVGIRDSRQSLQLGLSMWRLSWITFIFLPLTFIVGFFGMNVDTFQPPVPSIGWYFVAAVVLMVFVLLLWYCVKHSLQRSRQTPYQRGLYERLYNDLEDDYPDLWTSGGAVEDVEPTSFNDRVKWSLLKRWFAPEKTINKRLYGSLASDGEADLGAWAGFKRYLLERWLKQIQNPPTGGRHDAIAMAEVGAGSSTEQYETTTINELARFTTPLAVAGAEPTAAVPLSMYGLRPLNLVERRGSTRTSEEGGRPSSRGSSGMMIEERNLSDSESEAGGDAVGGARRASA